MFLLLLCSKKYRPPCHRRERPFFGPSLARSCDMYLAVFAYSVLHVGYCFPVLPSQQKYIQRRLLFFNCCLVRLLFFPPTSSFSCSRFPGSLCSPFPCLFPFPFLYFSISPFLFSSSALPSFPPLPYCGRERKRCRKKLLLRKENARKRRLGRRGRKDRRKASRRRADCRRNPRRARITSRRCSRTTRCRAVVL